MILHIITSTPEQERRDFNCEFDDLEEAYDFMLSVKQKGDTFLKAEFIDERNWYCLPVEDLNSGLSLNPFYQLNQQWEQCLSQSLISNVSPHGSLDALKERLLKSRQACRANLEETLRQMLMLQESAQSCLREGPRKAKLIRQYALTIDRCRRSLAQQ